MGTPDFQTPEHVMKAVAQACMYPENYHYSLGETRELLDAVVSRYKTRYQAEITPEEVMAVYGSQEGMAHIFLPLLNPGDLVLLPDFCYRSIPCAGTAVELSSDGAKSLSAGF